MELRDISTIRYVDDQLALSYSTETLFVSSAESFWWNFLKLLELITIWRDVLGATRVVELGSSTIQARLSLISGHEDTFRVV